MGKPQGAAPFQRHLEMLARALGSPPLGPEFDHVAWHFDAYILSEMTADILAHACSHLGPPAAFFQKPGVSPTAV